jgi:hypothetical protein
MKIYKVYRTDRVGYDEYDSWVVVANSPKEAKALCQWHSEGAIVKAKEIKLGKRARTILGSFNAG